MGLGSRIDVQLEERCIKIQKENEASPVGRVDMAMMRITEDE